MNYKEFDKQAKEIGVGNRCLVSIGGKEITDARLQKEESKWFICQDSICGVACKDKLGYKYSYWVYSASVNKVDYLKPYEVKYKEGDVLVSKDGYRKMVLDVSGRVYHMSDWNNFEAYDGGYTIQELDKEGYKLHQEEEKERDTVEFGGKVYDKEEFEKRIEALKEVEV